MSKTARAKSPAKNSSPTRTKRSASQNVFSAVRTVALRPVALPDELRTNVRLRMDGLEFLAGLPEAAFPVAFFDPQYRGVLDRMQYGNEGQSRLRTRCELPQMGEETITAFIRAVGRALAPSGHLFLWMDKFHLCRGFQDWIADTSLEVVDMVNWDKVKMGMGYRTRRNTEHCVVLQQLPRRAKGVWQNHAIPDTWREKLPEGSRTCHPHRKPAGLQGALIEAVSNANDIVIDPAAGSFSVMEAANSCGRNFLGCDING